MRGYKPFDEFMQCEHVGGGCREGDEYIIEDRKIYRRREDKEHVISDRGMYAKVGFTAYENPLDCLLGNCFYHEVEVDQEINRRPEVDSRIFAKKLKIGKRISLSDLITAATRFNREKYKRPLSEQSADECGVATASDRRGVALATGKRSVASATGECGAAITTQTCSASVATDRWGAATATGWNGVAYTSGNGCAASSTGDSGMASSTGVESVAVTTGLRGTASVSGQIGVALATGAQSSAAAEHEEAIAVAWGIEGKAKGVMGAHIVCAEWEYMGGTDYKLVDVKMARVDGEHIKPDTWYCLHDGEFFEL